jgi:aminoglycoside phosphotransferase (APT) family kinase protein
MSGAEEPDAAMAMRVAAAALGGEARSVNRFTTGMMHYVFEVAMADGATVVVRMNKPARRSIIEDALTLSRRLRPLGVMLPRVLAADCAGDVPYLVLERLPGSDLGLVIDRLDSAQLERIAAEIARMQQIVARLPSAGRYGYAASAPAAPDSTWSAVLDRLFERARRRIHAAGLPVEAPIEAMAAAIERYRGELDRQPATPFLHDTTTKNVIVTADGRLSGIVDVDDLCFGDPRLALALTQAALVAWGGPLGYVDAWMRAAGHVADQLFRLYVALHLVDFFSACGHAFNGNPLPASVEDRRRLQALAIAAIGRIDQG